MRGGITAICISILPSFVLALLKTRDEIFLKKKFCRTQRILKHYSYDSLFIKAVINLSLPPEIGLYTSHEISEIVYESELKKDSLIHGLDENISSYLSQTKFSPTSLNRCELLSLFDKYEVEAELNYGYIATVPEFMDNYQNFLHETMKKLKVTQLYKLVGALKRGVSHEVINTFLRAEHFDYFEFAEYPLWDGIVGRVLLEYKGTFDIIQIAKYEDLIEKIINEEDALSKKVRLSFIFPEYASVISTMKYSRISRNLLEPIEYRKLFSKLSPLRREMERHVDWNKFGNLMEECFAGRIVFNHFYEGWKENKYFDKFIARLTNSYPVSGLTRPHKNYHKKVVLEERQGVIYGVLQEKVGFIGPIDYLNPEVDNVFEGYLWAFLHPSHNWRSAHVGIASNELWYLYQKLLESLSSVVKNNKMTLSRLSFGEYNLQTFFEHNFAVLSQDERLSIRKRMHTHLSEMFGMDIPVIHNAAISNDLLLEQFLDQFLDQCDPVVAYRKVVQLLKGTFDLTICEFLITCHARLAVRYPALGLPLYARPLFDKPLSDSIEILLAENIFSNWSDNIEDLFNNMSLIYLKYDPRHFVRTFRRRGLEGQTLRNWTDDYETDIRMLISTLDEESTTSSNHIYVVEDFPW